MQWSTDTATALPVGGAGFATGVIKDGAETMHLQLHTQLIQSNVCIMPLFRGIPIATGKSMMICFKSRKMNGQLNKFNLASENPEMFN